MHPKGLPSKVSIPSRFGQRWGEGETADSVARLLQAAGHKFVSGERICRKLKVSRTAVWKAVRQLKREGYTIEASRRTGYRLRGVPDVLLPRIIQDGLRASVLGSSLISFRRASSTNDIGLYLAARGCPDGCVVTAETQWGGRGRLGRRWHSPPEMGLWFSSILRPPLPVSGAQVLTFLGAVAAARAIRALLHVPVVLRWPNDLVLGKKKLGGVLVELTAEFDLIRHVVLGVGLNVNFMPRDFPEPLRATATSLREILGRPVARAPLLRRVLEEMDRRYAELRMEGSTASLVDEWRALTHQIGQIVRVSHLSQVREGTVMGVDSDGALLLRSPAGTVDRLLAGDVTILHG